MGRAHIVERAFQIAGQCSSIEELARLLDREGYVAVHDHLASSTLRTQLKKLMQNKE